MRIAIILAVILLGSVAFILTIFTEEGIEEVPVHSEETLEVIHANDSIFVLEDGEEYYNDKFRLYVGDSVKLHYYRESLVSSHLQYNKTLNKSFKQIK